jgi:RNA polymerase sigma factor (sigma-70 family)
MDQEKTTVANQQNDIHIWETFLQGSETSFKELHYKYYNDLYTYALKITGDKYIAKNAIQELFIYLWKNKANLSKAQNIRFYLLFSLRRHVIRLLKKEQKHIHLSIKSIKNEEEAFPLTFSPEDILVKKETELINQKCVVEALNKLPPRQKEIIYLRYFMDMSIDEIAQMLSVNYQSLLNVHCRAMKNLRKLILNQKILEKFLFFPLLTGVPFLF